MWSGEGLVRNKLIFEMHSKKEDEFRSGQIDGFSAIGQGTEEKVFSRVTCIFLLGQNWELNTDGCKNSFVDENVVYQSISAD